MNRYTVYGLLTVLLFSYYVLRVRQSAGSSSDHLLSIWSRNEEQHRPPLSDLIGDLEANITGDVQFLLDFAIVAHPKTATTTHLLWLESHPEIRAYRYELQSLERGKPAELVSLLYALPGGQKIKRGYKAPRDIFSRRALVSLDTYWPQTKLIVGLRHPVRWFESFYNYRLQDYDSMPPPESLVGPCFNESHGVCTNDARFHLTLSRLRKTNITGDEELLLHTKEAKGFKLSHRLPNPVFLYEMSQIHDENQTRLDQYRKDLKEYLGLKRNLGPIIHANPGSKPAGSVDICEDRYSEIRWVLMQIADEASAWITDYFLGIPDVTVSSPDYFQELLSLWKIDPCENNK